MGWVLAGPQWSLALSIRFSLDIQWVSTGVAGLQWGPIRQVGQCKVLDHPILIDEMQEAQLRKLHPSLSPIFGPEGLARKRGKAEEEESRKAEVNRIATFPLMRGVQSCPTVPI